MKKLLTSYTFDASAKTVTSDDFTSLEKIQLITNVTDQIIIYNFADTTKGGSLTSTTITLEYDTTTMDDADKLQIFVEDGTAVQPVSGTFYQVTQPISAASLPLPTGAATSAKQDTLDTSVNTLLKPASTLAAVTAITNVVHVDDNAGSLTVDGTVTANLSATDNAVLDDIALDTEAIKTSLAGTLTVTGGGGGIQYTEADTDASITGTAALVEGAANALAVLTQPLTDTQLRATPVPISGSVTADLGANNDVTVTSGSITATQATGTNLHVVVDSAPTTAVTGTFYQATQPVSFTGSGDVATQTTLAAMNAKMVTGTDIGDVTINNSTGAAAVNIQDGGNTITVDGTVAVTSAGITTIAGAVAGTEMQVDVLTMPTVTVNSHAVTNVGTFAVQAAEADGANVTLGAKADAKSTATDTTAISAMSVLKQISASVQAPPSQAVTNAGTFAVQAAATLAAETTKVIGTVNVAASQTIGVTQATAGNLNCTEASASAIKTAVEVIDNAISGSEMQVDVVAALPAGTNAIGKLAANSGVDIGDVDILSIAAGTNIIGKTGHDITGIGHGVKVVTTAGTDVALAASTACKKVDIQSQTDNTSLIAVGGSGVDATIATGTGIILNPGESYSLEIDNLADIYIDSLVNGEGVRFTYYT